MASRRVLPKLFYQRYRYELKLLRFLSVLIFPEFILFRRNFTYAIPPIIVIAYLLTFTGILVINRNLSPPATSFDIVDEKPEISEQSKDTRDPQDMDADHTYSIQQMDFQLYL